MTNVHFTL